MSLAWTWPDDEFLGKVAADGFLPEDVLRSAELRELVLPALRGDYEAVETHVSGLAHLDCPRGGRAQPDVRASPGRGRGDRGGRRGHRRPAGIRRREPPVSLMSHTGTEEWNC